MYPYCLANSNFPEAEAVVGSLTGVEAGAEAGAGAGAGSCHLNPAVRDDRCESAELEASGMAGAWHTPSWTPGLRSQPGRT